MSALAQEATFPKADWPGAGGCPPLQRSSVGIRWVSPQLNQYWMSCRGRKGSKWAGPFLIPLVAFKSSVAACFAKGKSSLFEMSTDLIAKVRAFFHCYSFPHDKQEFGKITVASSPAALSLSIPCHTT